MLTPMDIKLIRLLKQGKTCKEIAIVCRASLPAIKMRVHRIYNRTGIRNRVLLAQLSDEEINRFTAF